MVGTIVSTIKSFYSATHYEWAAYERSGIGLTYIFGLAALLCMVFSIGLYVAGHYMGLNFGDQLLNQLSRSSIFAELFETLGLSNGIIYYALMICLISLGFTLYVINFAIIIAILAMPINYGLGAKMTYDQLLRVTVYAIVPATIITILLTYFAKPRDHQLVELFFFIIVTLYECYAIICAKRYLHD